MIQNKWFSKEIKYITDEFHKWGIKSVIVRVKNNKIGGTRNTLGGNQNTQ
jgi:hypothetical protein